MHFRENISLLAFVMANLIFTILYSVMEAYPLDFIIVVYRFFWGLLYSFLPFLMAIMILSTFNKFTSLWVILSGVIIASFPEIGHFISDPKIFSYNINGESLINNGQYTYLARSRQIKEIGFTLMAGAVSSAFYYCFIVKVARKIE